MLKQKKANKSAPRKTITFQQFQAWSFINSKRLPQDVEIGGRDYHWVGFGWVDHGPAKGDKVLVVD